MGQKLGKHRTVDESSDEDAPSGLQKVSRRAPIMQVVEEQLEVQRELLNPYAFAADAETPQRTAAGAMLLDVPTGRSNTMLRIQIKGSVVVHAADGYPLAIAFENEM